MTPGLADIRDCLDGSVPALVATGAPGSVPVVMQVPQVLYVDPRHVAVHGLCEAQADCVRSADARATVMVTHPETAASHRLYVEGMPADAGDRHPGGSQAPGGAGVGIYRVRRVERVAAGMGPRRGVLAAVREIACRIARSADHAALPEIVLEAIDMRLGMRHGLLLLSAPAPEQPRLAACRGMAPPATAALLGDAALGRAMRKWEPARAGGPDGRGERLAIPVVTGDALFGVLYVEARERTGFTHDDEDALVAICHALGLALKSWLVAHGGRSPVGTIAPEKQLVVRRYARDNSIFIDGEYLIKGVAGAILWTLLKQYDDEGTVDFSNRILRREKALGLPGLVDNLEARLILLDRRLTERCDSLRMEKTGRGQFRLRVGRSLLFEEVMG